MAASRGKLGKLHGMLADYFMYRLEVTAPKEPVAPVEGAEGEEEDFDFVLPLNPSELGHMVAFLKNNDITATPDEESMQKLKSEFTDEYELARNTQAKAMVTVSSEDAERASWLS